MKIYKAEIVTIPVPSGTTQTKFYFPDNAVIRTDKSQIVKTKGLEFFPSQVVAKAPDGGSNMSSVDLIKAYVTLYINDGEYYKVPLVSLLSVANNETAAGAPNFPRITNLRELADLNVNWPKSYISFSAALAATDVQIVCCVYYDFYRV